MNRWKRIICPFILIVPGLFAQDNSWEDQTVPFEYGYISDISFFNGNNGWALGQNDASGGKSVVLRTTDGGNTWTTVNLPDLGVNPRSVYTNGPNKCYVVGRYNERNKLNYTKIVILKTENSGTSWTPQTLPDISGYVVRLIFPLPSRGVAVGINTTESQILILYTDDDATWHKAIHPAEEFELRKVVFPDPHHGWVYGSYVYPSKVPCIFKTSDGGVNWSRVDHPVTDGVFRDICFVDANTGWLPGTGRIDDVYGDFLLHTKNGGTDWIQVSLDIPNPDVAPGKSMAAGDPAIYTFQLHQEAGQSRCYGIMAATQFAPPQILYTTVSQITFEDDFYRFTDTTFFDWYSLTACQVFFQEPEAGQSMAKQNAKMDESWITRSNSFVFGTLRSKVNIDIQQPVIKKKKPVAVRFNDGVLHVTVRDDRNIKIGRDSNGNVIMNNEPLLDEDGNPVKADNVHKMAVFDEGAGNNKIDLSDVNRANFPNIPQSYVNMAVVENCNVQAFCGAGNETVICSDLGTYARGGDGNDEIYTTGGSHRIYGDNGNDYIYSSSQSDKSDLHGDSGDDTIFYNKDDYVDSGEDNDELIKNPLTANQGPTHKKAYTAMDLNETVLLDSLVDTGGIDTLNFSLDAIRHFIDLDLTTARQVVDDNGTMVYLNGRFENYTGGAFNDVIHVDPLDVPRYIDGGEDLTGDTLYFDTRGKTVNDNGTALMIAGYEPVYYTHIETVLFESTTEVENRSSDFISGLTFRLNQNFPNPFNPDTKIDFSIPEKDRITLKVYNILGEEVAVLVDGILNGGIHSITFDAENLHSGLYIYRLTSGMQTQMKKMMILK